MKPREDKDYNVINLVFNCGEEKAQVIGISEMSEKKESRGERPCTDFWEKSTFIGQESKGQHWS